MGPVRRKQIILQLFTIKHSKVCSTTRRSVNMTFTRQIGFTRKFFNEIVSIAEKCAAPSIFSITAPKRFEIYVNYMFKKINDRNKICIKLKLEVISDSIAIYISLLGCKVAYFFTKILSSGISQQASKVRWWLQKVARLDLSLFSLIRKKSDSRIHEEHYLRKDRLQRILQVPNARKLKNENNRGHSWV